MLSSAVKKYARLLWSYIWKKYLFFLQIMIVHTKVQYHLIKKELKLKSIIDIREHSNSKIVKEAIESLGIKIYWSHTVVDTEGYKRLKEISIMELSKDGINQ